MRFTSAKRDNILPSKFRYSFSYLHKYLNFNAHLTSLFFLFMRNFAFSFLVLGLCIFATTRLQAQLKTTVGALSVGASYFHMEELNKALKTLSNYPIPNRYTNFGANLYHVNKRWVYGVDAVVVAKVTSVSTVNTPGNAYIRNFALIPKVGFTPFIYQETSYIYPTIGIGAGNTFLKRIDSLNLIIYKYNVYGMFLNAAINFTIFNPIPSDNDTQFVISGSLGYNYVPGSSFFQNKKLIKDQSVSMNPQGFYFTVSMGMGEGRFKRKEAF